MDTSRQAAKEAPALASQGLSAQFGSTASLCRTGDWPTSPLLTPEHLGKALPDLIEVSVFSNDVLAAGNKAALTANAEHYFSRRPGAVREDSGGPLGLFFSWREGPALYRLYAKKRFSLALSLNLPRIAGAKLGIPGTGERHGNSSLPLLAEGYDQAGLRMGMCQDIIDAVSKAKTGFRELTERAFGLSQVREIHANFSAVELAYDFAEQPTAIQAYERAFGKIFIAHEGASGLSGSLRKGERFAVYGKDESIRFELKLSGRRVKALVGSQRVPESPDKVESVFRAVEERYLPAWLDVEAHRLAAPQMSIGEFAQRLPRARNRKTLDSIAHRLAVAGKVACEQDRRSLLGTLTKRGLVSKARVRGWRLASLDADRCWQTWGHRP